MSENTDFLLPGEAQKSSPIVPGIHIGALGFGDHSVGLQTGEPMERDRFGER